MMRRSGLGVVWWIGLCTLGVGLGGCTRPLPPPQETTVSASAPVHPEDVPVPIAEAALPGGAPQDVAPIELREIKLLDDNGQQGLFVKLTGPPAAVSHHVLTQPTRLVVAVDGTGGAGAAQTYTVDGAMISAITVERPAGSILLTIALRGDAMPTYAVNDLNDTVVAFLGEPTGALAPVREQVLFTRRAVQTARHAPQYDPAELMHPQAPVAPRHNNPAPPAAGASNPAPDAPSAEVRPARRQVYQGQHVSLDFKDADVHNVLRLIAEVSKLNIVATEDVQGKVTLRLFDVPWDQALDTILQVLNLESTQEGNVLRISTVKRLREEREELQRAQEAAKAVEPLHIDYLKVNYAKALKLGEIISGAARLTSSQSQGGGRGGGGQGQQDEGVLSNRGSVFVDEFSNTIIVRDIQRGIDNARELVRRLDIQTPQVLIESNIVEATTNFARDLGIQWGYRSLHSPQTGNPTGVNFPGIIGLGGSGLGVGAGGVPFIADFPAAVGPGSGSALDLALGSIDGSKSLDMRLTALESDGQARIISRPRVVTLNNVAATIKSLTILRVKLPGTGTVINTGAGGEVGGQTTATEKIETGIVLIVTPQVSSDGYILLDMFAKSSQPDFSAGRSVDGIPNEISREANSHILVKNGQTVVLGGIYRDNMSESQTGIPYLSDIPALGWLFRQQFKGNRREDLLVFLTPRIMGGLPANLPSAEELWQNRDAGVAYAQ